MWLVSWKNSKRRGSGLRRARRRECEEDQNTAGENAFGGERERIRRWLPLVVRETRYGTDALPALELRGFEDLYISVFVGRTLKQFVGFIEHFKQSRGLRICRRASHKHGAYLFRYGHYVISNPELTDERDKRTVQ